MPSARTHAAPGWFLVDMAVATDLRTFWAKRRLSWDRAYVRPVWEIDRRPHFFQRVFSVETVFFQSEQYFFLTVN